MFPRFCSCRRRAPWRMRDAKGKCFAPGRGSYKKTGLCRGFNPEVAAASLVGAAPRGEWRGVDAKVKCFAPGRGSYKKQGCVRALVQR